MILTLPTPLRTSVLAMTVPRAPQPTTATDDVKSRSCPAIPISGSTVCLAYRSRSLSIEELYAQVPLSRIGKDDDEVLGCVLRPGRDLQSGSSGSTRRDTRQDALF